MEDTSQTMVQEHYSEVAADVMSAFGADAVIGCSSCCEDVATKSEASHLYEEDALRDLPEAAKAASRGCGDPIAKADIRPGERVLDLGSGGGIDALIAARLVGDSGYVYGLDMTEEMVKLATENAKTAGVSNIEFIKGLIEEIPLDDDTLDVVISNCVINLCEHKSDAFREARRVLREGGRIVVSDIVAFQDHIPEGADSAYRRLSGCLNGVNTLAEYEEMLHDAGFQNVSIEPKTVYTMEVLREKAERKDRMDSFAVLEGFPEIDGATGSAIIIAS